MQKKTLLIACNNLQTGGIQRALLNLLFEVQNLYDVTVFLFHAEDASKLPPNVKLICGNRYTRIMGMSQADAKRMGRMTALWRAACTLLTRAFGCGVVFRLLCKMQRLPEQYDVAISYMQNSAYRYFYGGCNEWIVNSVKSKKKISFVHCDFASYIGNHSYNRKYYQHFDSIVCVSEACKRIFDACCPAYVSKTVVVRNFCNREEIVRRASAFPVERPAGKTVLLTSARISEEKGILRMFPILAALKQENLQFVWRIVGDGPQREEAQALCERYGLSDCVIFHGMQENPYPFFAASDILLIPSYNEAAPMVYAEAAVLGIPVLTTRTTSAYELVREKHLGMVCENHAEAIQRALSEVLRGKTVLSTVGYQDETAETMQAFRAVVEEELTK